MSDAEIPKRKFNVDDLPRTFMSPAYFEEAEKGVFVMYRDVLVETDERDFDGTRLREKLGKRIGPMFRCRLAEIGERADFTTSRPDGTVLMLVKLEP